MLFESSGVLGYMKKEIGFTESIIPLLLGASQSVEVMLSLDEGWNFPLPIDSIIPIVDERLELRLLLRSKTSDESAAKDFVGKHKCERWTTRFLRHEGTANCIIIDRNSVLVVPFRRDSEDYVIDAISLLDDPIRVNQISGHFERLWIQTDKDAAAIYEDIVFSSIPKVERSIATISTVYWEKAIQVLSSNPTLLHQLPPRKFEELIAELLSDQGLEVTLTPPTKDGGFDILAYDKSVLGKHLFLVECKRYAPNRPVGVEFVRALFGVVEKKKATGGMIVTSSRFTADAIQESNDLRYRMSLRDYNAIREWLKRFKAN